MAGESNGSQYITYSPIIDRPRIVWPGGARLALWISPNVEFYEYEPPVNPYRVAWSRVPAPDVRGYSWRDYGNRVGFWRMAEVLDHHGIRATASLNLTVLDQFPEIGKAMVDRDWAFMSHGLFNTRYLFGMSLAEERQFIQDNVATLRRHTGRQLKGMFGPAASLTPNTMELIAEAGLTYSCDWYVDDQPFPLNVSAGRLVSVPYTLELNDGLLMTGGLGPGLGSFEGDYFLQICKDQFDVLYKEGTSSGRVMCIALHTFIIGQPHRIRFFHEALDYILSHDGIWITTADEIADYYLEHFYESAVAHMKTRSEDITLKGPLRSDATWTA